MRRLLFLASLLLAAGCGYHLAGASRDPLGPFIVTPGEVKTPYAAVMAAAEEGARAELSRQGALAAGGADTTAIVIEILRVDEASEAPALTERAGAKIPLARALRVTVLGRASLRRDGREERVTGDVRATEIAARELDPTTAILSRDASAARAARRLGEVLARRVLGFPEPGEP